MLKKKYLSPSGIKAYLEDPTTFYYRYIATEKMDRDPQTRPMSIGSALDAYVKSYLHSILFGPGKDPRFNFETIFESMVEPLNRDWAKEHGKYVFDCYKESGALGDLLLMLRDAITDPRFEFEVEGRVSAGMTVTNEDVVLLGKPDVFFINKEGQPVILDFKVNGYCSQASPSKGYIQIRGKTVKSSSKHPDAVIATYQGMKINTFHFLEDVNPDWAVQLAVYGWLCGQKVGDQFITAIDQFACNGKKEPVEVRIAEHRTRVSRAKQQQIFETAKMIWDISHSDHFFRDLTIEESQEKCRFLENQASLEKEHPLWKACR